MQTHADPSAAVPQSRFTVFRPAVRFLVRHYYSQMEISDAERIPHTGPVLLCANHANALIDPVIVGIASGRDVRFLAKAPLFEIPILGQVMKTLGMIPAYRASDDSRDVRKNLGSLDEGAHVLQQGDALGIFPEGKSHDLTRVEMVRSGAARMALQAAADGAERLQVVPIGINYERKDAFRSTVWVRVGEPIDVDALRSECENDRIARHTLTRELERHLRFLVVHLEDSDWSPFLEDLEHLAPKRFRLSSPDFAGDEAAGLVAIRRRKWIADAMNHFLKSDADRAHAMAERIRAFRTQVRAAGLTLGAPILERQGVHLAVTLLWQVLWLTLLLGPSLLGTVFHLIPFLLTRGLVHWLTPKTARKQVTTYRLAAGLPIYLAWYALAAVALFQTFPEWRWLSGLGLLLMPALGLIGLSFWRFARTPASVMWHELKFLFHRGQLNALRAERNQLRRDVAQLADEFDEAFRAMETASEGQA